MQMLGADWVYANVTAVGILDIFPFICNTG